MYLQQQTELGLHRYVGEIIICYVKRKIKLKTLINECSKLQLY